MKKYDSMAIELYNLLKNKIITMELMPGQILIAQQLSSENKISRTPVREALIRLENIGFVENATGGKYRVTNITWKFIVDLYSIRSVLETTAIQKNISVLTEKDYSILEDYNNMMEQALEKNELNAFFENDLNFHNYILDVYGNQVVSEWVERLNDSQQRIRYITVGIEGRMQESILEHQNLICHLRRKNEGEAVSVLQKHLMSVVQEMEKLKSNQFTVPSRIIKW